LKINMFKKTKEDFTCEQCGESVMGDGFTNHCPVCLWSKHVDITPGDRLATCGGIMEPIALRKQRGEYQVLHVCVVCGYKKYNKLSEHDSQKEIVRISSKPEHIS